MTDTAKEPQGLSATVVVCSVCGTRNRVPAAAPGTPRCGRCHSALPWVADALDETFAAVVQAADIPVLVDIWAEWCGPCRQVSPVLEQLSREMAGRIKLVKVDADRAPGVSRKFDVQAIPTLMLLNHGEVVARQVGAAPPDVLRRWLEGALTTTEGDRHDAAS